MQATVKKVAAKKAELKMSESERAQRAALSARLAGRKRKKIDVEDIGKPYFSSDYDN